MARKNEKTLQTPPPGFGFLHIVLIVLKMVIVPTFSFFLAFIPELSEWRFYFTKRNFQKYNYMSSAALEDLWIS